MKTYALLLAAAGGVILVSVLYAGHQPDEKQAPAKASPLAAQAVQIFADSCASAKCHAGEKPKEKMVLTDAAGLKSTVINVKAEQAGLMRIAPGQPEESYLFLKITKHRREGDKRLRWKAMPPGPKRLDDAQIAVIEAWIKAGAPLE